MSDLGSALVGIACLILAVSGGVSPNTSGSAWTCRIWRFRSIRSRPPADQSWIKMDNARRVSRSSVWMPILVAACIGCGCGGGVVVAAGRDRDVKAFIRYDEDGTKRMSLEAEHISSQMWWCGRTQTCMAMVTLSENGVVTRVIQFAAVYSIDVDRTDGWRP